jgi:hypothetical protein
MVLELALQSAIVAGLASLGKPFIWTRGGACSTTG